MSKKATVKKVSGKSKSKPEKLHEPVLTSTPDVKASEPVAPKGAKNIITTPSGATIAVRGPEQKRIGYSRGNVGWQEMIAFARSIYHLAYSSVVVGMPDPVIKDLTTLADEVKAGLNREHVTIPGDLVTQLNEVKAGFDDLPPGAPGYKKAIKRLSDMAKFIDDAKLRARVEAETVKAMSANTIASAK